MSKISIGATGNLITGDVLDVNPAHLEKKLQEYEPRLYLKWNPTKNQGNGKWELRIRPEKKSIVQVFPYQGDTLCIVDYKENNFENHIFDLDSLNYTVLQRVKDADMWAASNYERGKEFRISEKIDEIDNGHYQKKYNEKQKLMSDMLYNLRQDKGVLRDFQNKLLSGVNPNHLLRFWK